MIDVGAVVQEMRDNVGFVEGWNNDNPWGDEQGVGNYQPYCASFAYMIAYRHGYRWDGDSQFGERGDAYVPYAEDHGFEYGEATADHASSGSPAPIYVGSQVTFDWNGSGDGDHIETCVDNHGDPYGPTFTTVGANTGNPEGVHLVERDRRYLHVVRTPRHYSDDVVVGPPAPNGRPELRLGAKGPAVVDLQTKLNQRGQACDIDGDFGPQTDGAVRAFQSAAGLTVDGVVGPDTWGRLDDATQPAPPPPAPPDPGPGPSPDTGVREGVDVSDYQDVDWQTYIGTGRRWAAIKVTEGTVYVSARFNQNRLDSGELGGRVLYHFAGSSVRGTIGDPVEEADFCLDHIAGGLRAEERVALDYELQYGQDRAFMNVWSATFGRRVTERTATRPWLYSSSGFLDFNDTTDLPGIFDLWVASWNTDSPGIDRWVRYTAHQFTDVASVPGVSSPCDDNHLVDSVSAIFGGGGGAPPGPPPPPPPAGNTFTPLDVDGEVGPPQDGQAPGVYQSCRALQYSVGTGTDGEWGPDTCRATQQRVGTAVDGEWGPNSTRSLQARVGADTDGEFGPDTAKHLQAALNAGAF